MTKLTVLEQQVMKAIPQDNFYEEGFTSVLWSNIFSSEVDDLEAKKVRGVMTSLIKKNMIWVEKSETPDDGPTMGLTSEGIAWLKENCDFLTEDGYVIKKSNNSNNEGEIVMNEVNVEGKVEEVVEAPVTEIENAEVEIAAADVEVVTSENEDAAENASDEEIAKTEDENIVPASNPDTEENRRVNGIGVQWYINDEFKTVFPSIQAAARELKVYLQRDTMPYTIIHKSIREGISYTHPATNEKHVFHFENPADKKTDYKTRVSKSSGTKGAGKLVDWFENGVFKQQFPSIKAAVEFMKTYLGLPHNPYTAVLKSLNENQDFNQHSFKFSTEAREAAPAVASEEVAQVVEAPQAEEQEIVEVADAEVELSENEVIEA
jgi:hypothetical protein